MGRRKWARPKEGDKLDRKHEFRQRNTNRLGNPMDYYPATENVYDWPEECSVSEQYLLPVNNAASKPWVSAFYKLASCRNAGEDNPWLSEYPYPPYPDELEIYRHDVEYAKSVCATCPVRAMCRQYVDTMEDNATGTRFLAGVWAGEDKHERVKRRRSGGQVYQSRV